MAERQRQISDGKDGSKLNEGEAAAVDVAVQRRNMADCLDGRDGCDHSLLSRSEAYTLAAAERTRNHTACLSRHGYCDRSRLTPSEAAAIPREPKPTPQ